MHVQGQPGRSRAGVGLEQGRIHSEKCTFIDNQTATNGGGFWIGDQADGTLVGNLFASNVANFGGAVHTYVCSGTLLVDDCDFEDNIAHERGGAFHMQKHHRAIIVNSRLKKNRALFGGALSSESASAIQIRNCAFSSTRPTMPVAASGSRPDGAGSADRSSNTTRPATTAGQLVSLVATSSSGVPM